MAPAQLRVRLLGPPDFRLGEHPLPVASARVRSLLAFLLLRRDIPHARQSLAFLLWPDSTESQALTNLRHLLHTIRGSLPEIGACLEVTARTVRWRAGARVDLDVDAFTAALTGADQGDPDGLDRLILAVESYTGDLLAGCSDEWVLEERAQLRLRFEQALTRLVDLLASRGEHARAVGYAERLLRQDALREESYLRLMRLHEAAGDRARAVHSFHLCATTLERELGVQPSDAVRSAYDALLDRASPAPANRVNESRPDEAPLVGRTAERDRLAAVWRDAERGRAQLALVTGDAGIGKTRLVDELRAWCDRNGVHTATARSFRAEGELVYGPVVSWLRALDPRELSRRLDPMHTRELARLLPELPDTPGSTPVVDSAQRQRLFDAIAAAITGRSAPVLLIADDVHLADHETLRFLHYLIRAEPRAPLMVAATARLEEIEAGHPLLHLMTGLKALGRLAEIALEPFSLAETTLLAHRITGQEPTAANARQLFRVTGGNPLFVVEALRADWRPDERAMLRTSPRIQAAIESRLATLSPQARRLVGLAAACGRSFPPRLLTAAGDLPEAEVVRALDELWRRRIVREHGPDSYAFAHGVIEEVAYHELRPVERQHLHRRIARALEAELGGDAAAVAGHVALHLERAGEHEAAVRAYESAALAAQSLYANADAVRLLQRAAALLRGLPPTPARRRAELGLLTRLAGLLGLLDGWNSPRLAQLCERASALAAGLGVELDPAVIRARAIASLSRRDFAETARLGQRLRVVGERGGDRMSAIESDYLLGIAAFWQGELQDARAHFEAAVLRSLPDDRPAHIQRFGLEPGVICLSRLANTLWYLGDPEGAVAARDRAIAASAEVGHPFTRAIVQVFATLLALEMGDSAALRAYLAEPVVDQAGAGMRQHRLAIDLFRSYLDVVAGNRTAGIARLKAALDNLPELDLAPGTRSILVRVMLEACTAAGDPTAGLSAATLALNQQDDERLLEAEFRRLRARFLRELQAPASDVEAELDRAIAVAHRQSARMLELRAAIDLVELRQATAEKDASNARQRLADIVSSLTLPEGSPERLRANALLSSTDPEGSSAVGTLAERSSPHDGPAPEEFSSAGNDLLAGEGATNRDGGV